MSVNVPGRRGFQRQAVCTQGHPFTADNERWERQRDRRVRRCLICHRARMRRATQAKRERRDAFGSTDCLECGAYVETNRCRGPRAQKFCSPACRTAYRQRAYNALRRERRRANPSSRFNFLRGFARQARAFGVQRDRTRLEAATDA